jgi:hypothetical protein
MHGKYYFQERLFVLENKRKKPTIAYPSSCHSFMIWGQHTAVRSIVVLAF